MRRTDSSDNHPGRLTWLIIVLIPILLVALLLTVFVVNNRPPNIVVPTPKMPQPNGYDDFVRATKLIGTIRSPYSDTRPVSSWTVKELEAFVKDNAGATAAVREGLGKECMHPPTRSYFDDAYQHNAGCRELARILTGEAMYYSATGDYGKAVDCRLDCIELGVMMPRGGSLIDHLVGAGIEIIGSKELAPLIAKLGPYALEDAAVRLEQIRKKRTSVCDVMMEEARATTACANEIYSMPENRNLKSISGWFLMADNSLQSFNDIKRNANYGFANKRRAILDTKAFYETMAKRERGHYKGRNTTPVPDNAITRSADGSDMSYILGAPCLFTHGEAILSLLQTEVALRRYRFDHGSYPASLKALTPKYLKKTPIDPFGLGKPLRYKPLNNGQDFLLYSLGPNLRDDGGVQGKWEGENTKGDIVAGKW